MAPEREHGPRAISLFRVHKFAAYLLCLCIWSVTPICWLYVIWTYLSACRISAADPLRTAPTSGNVLFSRHAILLYASFESLFSLYYRWLAHSVQARSPWRHLDVNFLHGVLVRSLESAMNTDQIASYKADEPPSFVQCPLEENDPRAVDFRSHMMAWFRMAPYESLRKSNVREWIAWSFWSMDLEEFYARSSKKERDFLEEALNLLQKRAAKTVPEGYNKALKSIRLTIDPVRVLQRPLFLYLLIKGFSFLVLKSCLRHGFAHHSEGDFDYLIRMRRSDQPPLLLLHGLGGIAQYWAILIRFATDSRLQDRTLIVPRQPHISQDLFHPRFLRPPTQTEFVEQLKRLVDRMGIHGPIDLLAHSNGTLLAGWIIKSYPELVGRLCLVDTVCFCLWEPDIPHNFLYAPVRSGIEVLIRYFVARELGTANTLFRHFDWTSNLLWAEEIPHLCDPAKTLIVLAGEDKILSARKVERYLLAHGMKHRRDGGCLIFKEAFAHGEALTADGPILREITAWLATPLQGRSI